MKTVIRGVVLAAGLVLCAVYLLPAVFFGVWSLGTWVGLAAGAVMAIGAKQWPAITEFCRKRRIRWLPGGILTVSVVLVFYSLALCGCMVFGALQAPPEDPEGTVVVLGSKVNGTTPSADLQARMDRAADYLLEHPDLAVRLESRQHPGGVVVVEQLAAELQIQLAAELGDALFDLLGLGGEVLLIVKTDGRHTIFPFSLWLFKIR